MTSFAAATAALRAGRARTDGIITHRFPLHQYGKALMRLRTTGPRTRSSLSPSGSAGVPHRAMRLPALLRR
jgi:hypothetical protein